MNNMLPVPASPLFRRLRLSSGVHGTLRLCTIGITAVLGALGGCAIQPWVQPYERERLADPIMQWQREGLAQMHREHIHSVREGARGATGVQGGGCGCN
jgi:Domain of unknown function (DUF4266)